MQNKLHLIAKRYIGPLSLLILIFLCQGCVVTLPPIKGVVYYEDGTTPAPDTYILSFTSKYPLIEAFNLGGPNSDYDDVEIVVTNSDGKFRLGSYWAIGLNYFDDVREYFIYKPGHSALRYFQSGIFSHTDENGFWSKHIKPKKKFVLPQDNRFNNKLIYVVANISNYAKHFKSEDKRRYKKNLKIFREIYQHLLVDYDAYVVNKNENWPRTMERLRRHLGLDK